MRSYIFLLALPLLLCFCKKDDPVSEPVTNPPVVVEPIIELGKASVLRNGKFEILNLTAKYVEWNGQKKIRLSSKRPYNAFVEEGFYILDIPLKVGKYSYSYDILTQDHEPYAGITWTVDGDQEAGSMHYDTSRFGQNFEIIRLDLDGNTLEGRFEVFFRNYSGPFPILPGVPDTVSFTQGKFHLKIAN